MGPTGRNNVPSKPPVAANDPSGLIDDEPPAPSQFGWPYYPNRSVDDLTAWLATWTPHLTVLATSKRDFDYMGRLTAEDVFAVNDEIATMSTELAALARDGLHSDRETLEAMPWLLNVLGHALVTNKTPDTTLYFENYSSRDTLPFGEPKLVTMPYVMDGGRLIVSDDRPNARERRWAVNFSPNTFYLGSVQNKVILYISMDRQERQVILEIDWYGPHYRVTLPSRPEPFTWLSLERLPVTAFDLIGRPREVPFLEGLAEWLPYIEALHKTKTTGVSCRLYPIFFREMLADIRARISRWTERCSENVQNWPDGPREFAGFMGCVHVRNRLPGSVIMVRIDDQVLFYPNSLPMITRLTRPCIIDCAELFLAAENRVITLTRQNTYCRNIEDIIQVIVEDCVVLDITWVGPHKTTPNGRKWMDFLNLHVNIDYHPAILDIWRVKRLRHRGQQGEDDEEDM